MGVSGRLVQDAKKGKATGRAEEAQAVRDGKLRVSARNVR